MSIVSKEEYWTTILNDYSQFGQITTEDSEFNSIANDVWNVLENSFIKIDDEESIIKWEEMTGLSGEGLTIFQRKVNILYTLTVKNYLPIGLFKQAMDRLVGKDNYIITFNEDTQKYEVECYVDYENSASFLNKRLANESVELEITPLPIGYLATDFLESSNGQRISIPSSFDTATDFKWSIKLQTTVSSGWGHAFGVRGSAGAFGVSFANSTTELELTYLQTGGYYVPAEFFVPLLIESDLIGTRVNKQDTKIRSVYNPISFTSIGLFWKVGHYYNFFTGRIWRANLFNAGKTVIDVLPALDPTGIPCMYELVSRKPFYNSVTEPFIVGMDMKQARKLSKLPARGGTLTVSLPSNYTEDEDVVNSLSTA